MFLSLTCSFLIQPQSVQKQNWCLHLAALSCASMVDDEHVKAVIDMGDSFGKEKLHSNRTFFSEINSCNFITNSELFPGSWSSHACFVFHLQPQKDWPLRLTSAMWWHIRNPTLVWLDARGILCTCVYMCMCVIIFPDLLLTHYSLCISLPDEVSAMKEAIERTEVYEYVLSLNSGCTQTNFQVGISLFLFFLSCVMVKQCTQNKCLYVS